ncbi:MAG TPA: glycoside hydrolase family 43 protein [Streptosporangiaceae bacterium]|nr:glycoside hydrolase family 43 protein [Streptosporangiaceae bacterium]
MTATQPPGGRPPAGRQPGRLARNPILPGCHPDPSICRIGADYFLVNSTFEYFPGLPVWQSRDLVNWRLTGHVLHRPGQLPLDGVRPSGGLFAPTMRHADGVTYVVCTLVDGAQESGNFVVTAPHPTGPWSDPVWLDDAPGFDPSLFFDDDGRAWFLGTRPVPGTQLAGRTQIWLREFDPAGLRLTGPEYVLFSGALVDAVWAEGPHLYRHDGFYYLLLAEGGSEHHHAVTVARSAQVTGPYQNNPANPVLTHRHLGRAEPIVGTGHADLVQTPAGDWHAVLHAMRPYGGYYPNLGRETFLASVAWEDGWPIINPGAGRVLAEFPAPLPEHPWPAEPGTDDFDNGILAPVWNVLRTPREEPFSLTARPGWLRLRLRPEVITQACHPSFVGRRQQHMSFTAATAMDFEPASADETAGLVLLRGTGHQIRLVVTADGGQGGGSGAKVARVLVRRDGVDRTVAQAPLSTGRTYLAVEAAGQDYTLRCAQDPARWQTLATVDGRVLSPAAVGDFTGAYLGMYASSNGRPAAGFADFDWFEYAGRG